MPACGALGMVGAERATAHSAEATKEDLNNIVEFREIEDGKLKSKLEWRTRKRNEV